MSKDESMCKVMGGAKHKERKPKKPHYIPRPWGKPYNYKCFQCPFTCMEKSHLYNHMKYSLCKNSLSLLIESDWPYKKGNLLPPDHIRLQQGALGPRSPAKEQSQRSADEAPAGRRRSEVPFSDDGEEAEGVAEGDANQGEETGTKVTAASQSPEPAEACPRGGAKCAKPEADLVMADVFSLEEQLLRARSVEVEAKLRHYRLSKTCLSTPAALLSEQWRLLGYSKPKAEASAPPQPPPPQLPCYPPPGSLDSQDATGLNLSLFGVGYPLPPSLFSYLNPTLNPTLNPVVSPTLGAGPFLTHAHADRSLLPPRLYYPFLCEHTFGNPVSADVGKTPGKPSVVGPDGAVPGYPLKQGMWKVPVLRPTSSQASHAAWASPAGSSPELGHPAGERPQAATGSREPGRKRAAVHMDSFESPAEKSAALGFPLNLLKSIHRTTPTTAMATDRLNLHNSVRAQTGVDDWFSDLGKAERTPSETPSTQSTSERDRAVGGGGEEGDGDADSATSLLHNLTKVLREYQHAEQRAAMMQSEERPAQRHLLAHLGKIRSELSHIQQALEQTARHSDGPLDLSVKKDQGATVTGEGTGQDAGDAKEASSETSSETEAEEEGDEEECEDEGMDAKERRKRSLDVLIKLNQVGVSMVKSEGLSGPWPGRTTKCEADSSVLLGPDHRPASLQTKTLGRSHSIPHFSTSMCPPSPLIASEPSDIP